MQILQGFFSGDILICNCQTHIIYVPIKWPRGKASKKIILKAQTVLIVILHLHLHQTAMYLLF